MRRFLSLWLPQWPIQRRMRELSAPEALAAAGADRPPALLLYREQAQRGLLVAACCPAAFRQGVRPGMPLTEAISLVGRGKQKHKLRVARADWQADQQALRELALACDCFSPLVGLDDRQPAEGLVLEVAGVSRLFGGEQELARQVLQAMRQRRYQARLAIASTLGAAWGVAHYGTRQPIQIIPAGEQLSLTELPVAALRLSAATLEALHRLGLHRLGQLDALPRRQLLSRFGDELISRLWQWRGEVPELIQPVERPLAIEAATELEYATGDRRALACLLGRLLPQIASQLEALGLGATQLECRLRGEAGEAATIRIGFCAPSDDPERMRRLLLPELEGLLLPGGVQSIRLRVSEHAPLERRQTELFSKTPAGEARELARLIELLSSRLGAPQVARPQLQEDYQPECAYTALPALEARGRGAVCRRLPPAGARPLVLIDPPAPLAGMVLDERGLPREFVYRREAMRVAVCGPREVLETGWWRGPTVRRAYHRVLTTGGGSLWLFRRLDDGNWFVQGEFA